MQNLHALALLSSFFPFFLLESIVERTLATFELHLSQADILSLQRLMKEGDRIGFEPFVFGRCERQDRVCLSDMRA